MSLLLRRRALLVRFAKFLRTVSGIPPIACEACTEEPVESYEIYGNSIQNGTPTPDTPVEVESVGEKSKNLFDINNIDKTRHLTLNSSNFNTSSLSTYNCSSFISVKPNTTYIKSGNFGAGVQAYFDSNKNFIGTATSIANDTPFTTPSNCAYIVVNLLKANAPHDTAQLEEGSTTTPYGPYGKYKIPVIAQGKNLFNIDNYGVLLDKNNQDRKSVV